MSKTTPKYVYTTKKGLNKRVVENISYQKKEPLWMKDFRLRSYEIFKQKPMPTWGADLSDIDFNDIYYYMKATEGPANTWDELPENIRETYEKIGIPQAEKDYLAGVSSQYDSETVYESLREDLEKQGVLFCDTDTALKKYPDILKQYLATLIPPADNKFAALNSACWSGGSFIYIPKGVKVEFPLQAYFHIQMQNMGQFERTLIIADEGSEASYVEGCFTKGTLITTNPDYKPIENIQKGDNVLTHTGTYKPVRHAQVRPYSGDLYTIEFYGDSTQALEVTKEHPILFAKRNRSQDRNKTYNVQWGKPSDLQQKDYLVMPINKEIESQDYKVFDTVRGRAGKGKLPSPTKVKIDGSFMRLIGYYLAEGSVELRGYVRFSFGAHEREYIHDVKQLLKKVFSLDKTYDALHSKNNGVSVTASKVELAQIFAQFGTSSDTKHIPQWAMTEDPEKQKELIKGLFRGDGNYYAKKHKSGFKQAFRINTTSEKLARQTRDILLRLGVVAFLNKQMRREQGRKDMFTIGIAGAHMKKFGEIVGIKVSDKINGHYRASMFGIDKNFAYVPIKNIKKKTVKNIPVYNFSVKKNETYLAAGVAVHNCSAPIYSSNSLHSAVVEIIVKRGARFRYTTIQNWSNNVYNLVTKRAIVEEEGFMDWIDCNLGSRKTMKYPGFILKGKGAKGEVLSVALAGKGQHQDAGAKAIHLAPYTSSRIISKSISKDGGRTSYRGLVYVLPGAKKSNVYVSCDALIMDEKSRSDTYPTMKVKEKDVSVQHEAQVERLSDEKLFYLTSRGIKKEEAEGMLVNGFIKPVIKEIPLEYAVEMNRLINLEMEGSVG
ncbi:Fe-S cluster assembly protein SufB [Patescibacteria group bacterium AH-259-L05]|nr:Fe-S cluster assembly protein SufB [Patescibacteria group bacterium AH-259-L05]